MKLLIVEDEKPIASAMEKVLKKDGYAIDIAVSAASAIELVEVNEYDLVLLDLFLPDSDDFGLLQKIREHSSKTRIIIVSANKNIEDRVQGLDFGANDYIVKPFNFDELKARIRALLRRDFNTGTSVITAGDFKLNISTHEVTYKDKNIILTLKEYSIFKYLVQNTNKIISAEELYNHVWNEQSNPFTEVMRVHIYSLRKKINNITGCNDIINTVKGAGYLFKLENQK